MILRSLTKIAGSASGSISQRYGSADPDMDPHQDPYQNVIDQQHWWQRQLTTHWQCMAQRRGAQPGFEQGNFLEAGRHHCWPPSFAKPQVKAGLPARKPRWFSQIHWWWCEQDPPPSHSADWTPVTSCRTFFSRHEASAGNRPSILGDFLLCWCNCTWTEILGIYFLRHWPPWTKFPSPLRIPSYIMWWRRTRVTGSCILKTSALAAPSQIFITARTSI